MEIGEAFPLRDWSAGALVFSRLEAGSKDKSDSIVDEAWVAAIIFHAGWFVGS
jgi:hypothetical protein